MTRDKVCTDEFYVGIDPGIRFAVRVLHAHGIETGQSCEGGEGHAYDWPTVDLWGETQTSGFAAFHFLHQYGLPVRDIARVWRVEGSELVEPLWRITFTEPMFDRQDERPGFVWGYEGQESRPIELV